MRKAFCLLVFLCLLPCPAPACSICGGMSRNFSLTYEFDQAAVVVYGTLANPRLDFKSGAGRGTTEFHIERVIKNHREFGKLKMLTLSRYLPILDAKKPPKYVMFIRSPKDSKEPYWGREISSPAVLEFVHNLLGYRDDPAQRLLYAAKYLDHADANVADEAFMLFAKADDKLIAKIAPKLSPVNLRKLVKNPDLEPERLSMFAYLLGSCGNADDAKVLHALLQNPPPRLYKAYEGILAGYITMRPKDGWAIAEETLKADKKSFLLRYAALKTMRFFYNARPEEFGPRVMDGMKLALATDLADVAIRDLSQWKRWDHTQAIIARWNAKQSPIVRQSIVRYALACPLPEARAFLARARREDPETVRDVEQELK